MTLANLTRFERLFDRGVAAYFLVLAVGLAGAVAMVGI